ncbi:MAG: hypothetical protein GTO03_14915, partial [Planctomycetales bacterium]|nr:hypothetical protein [Planctomycetales bacterium]
PRRGWRQAGGGVLVAAALVMLGLKLSFGWPLFYSALVLLLLGVYLIVRDLVPPPAQRWLPLLANAAVVILVFVALARHWMPLGIEVGLARNLVFIGVAIGGLLGVFLLFLKYYEPLLRFFLAHKLVFY